ncbi:MAG: FAD-dependent monooxygenase [Solirubrobacteraceae bacterium]
MTKSPAACASSGTRIGIVGGGIGGRAALLFLRHAGLSDVALYEQATRIADVGAGIQVSPNMARALKRLGLGAALDESGVRLEHGWEMRRWQDGRVLATQELGDRCERLYGAPYYAMHRADLLRLLGADEPDPDVRLGKRCVGVEQDDATVRLTFGDGSHADVDVAIGADGIHSVVQPASTTPVAPRFSGLAAYRCIVPAERAPELARRPVSTSWLGPGRHLVHYPVSAGREVNVVAAVPAGDWRSESWSARGAVEDFAACFAGWDRRVTELISAADEVRLHALFDRAPLDRWVSGRIGLLGDAAHPMLPAMAQGAAQAVEDAQTLADCLRAATPRTAGAALLDYQDRRRDRATTIQQLSRRRPDRYHLGDGAAQRRRDADLGERDQLLEHGWIYDGGPISSAADEHHVLPEKERV